MRYPGQGSNRGASHSHSLGTHTIQLMAIKDTATDANMVVADSLLSVIYGH
jgi:hypothetical protein